MTTEKGGRPLAFNSVEELEEKIEAYFVSEDCYLVQGDDSIYAPTMSGLALYLGVSRATIVNYSYKEQYFDTIKKARSKIETHLEQKLYGNTVTGVIFNLKNNFNWKDKSEVENTNVEVTHEQWLDSLD